MTSKNLVITYYPLDRESMDRISATIGGLPEQVVVSNVSARGYVDVLRFFRGLKADAIYVPAMEKTVYPVLPLLKCLTLISRTRKRLVIHSDFSLQEFGAADGLTSVFAIGRESLRAVGSVLGAWVRLRKLQGAPRIVATLGEGRVLYLKTNLWLGVQAGGSVAHTGGVIGALLKKQLDVDFASAEKPPVVRRGEVRYHPVAPPSSHVVPRELNYYRFDKKILNAVLGLRPKDYGFIYHRLSLGSFAAVVLSRIWRKPLVLEYNGSETWIARNWGSPLVFEKLSGKAEAACLRHAHLIVTVSDVLRDGLIADGIEPDRIVSHANGVDEQAFDPSRFSEAEILSIRERFGIPPDAVVVAFVGTFGQWHGVDILANTLRQMVETDPQWVGNSKLHVVFIGDGVKRQVVEETLAAPQFRPHYTITGLVSPGEVPGLMAASDILVSPHVPNPDGSPFFGSPTKLFEYLASGKAVIGSDLYQIGEVLKGCPRIEELPSTAHLPTDEQCGILVAPKSENELAMAIRYLVESPEWREGAGRNARRRVLDGYTWDHHVGAVLGGLRMALAKQAAAAVQRPTRVLVNGLHSKSGGGVTYLRNMLPLLAREPDLEIHLCIHATQRSLLPDKLEAVTLHEMSFNPGFWSLLFREQIDVPMLARRIGADVTFSPANYGPFFAPNSVILLRNALTVAFVERRPMKIGYWALLYLGTGISLLLSRRAIAVSEYARRSIVAGALSFLREKVAVVHHGVDPLFFQAEKEEEREDFLLAVSDIYVQKNLKNLVLAVAKVCTVWPGLRLKIAGRPVDAEYFASLKSLVVRMGIENHVEFLGHVPPEDLVRLYRRCRIFVFPSTVETFGNPLVEAMASGAPIASSGSAAMSEVAGDAALYFEPSRVDQMADVLDRLLRDGELRRELSLKAKKRVSRFSWDRSAKETAEILRQAASR